MSFRERMMGGMMNGMSGEERKEMLDKMMEKFFSGMSDEEKRKMMEDMMSGMTGGKGMMGMMSMMMGGFKGSGHGDKDGKEPEMPWDMCRKMMASMNTTVETAAFATPQLRGLFEEWVFQIEQEILDFVKEKKSVDPDEIAKNIKISRESIVYLLSRLARKGKVNFKVEEEKKDTTEK